MKKVSIAMWAVLVVLTAVFAGCAGGSENLTVREVLEETLERADIPGMAAVTIRDGKVYGEYYLGYADIEAGRPVNSDTRFMIASMSKPVTAAAVMLLVQDGRISLDEDISNYLDFKVRNPHYPEKAITVRMLLAHTSSISDNWDVLDPLYTLESGGGDSPVSLQELAIEYLLPGGRWYSRDDSFNPKYNPGETHEYCNVGYALLGLIIEKVDGRSYDRFSREEVLLPLGMESAQWLMKDSDAEKTAMPYSVGPRGAEALGHYGYPDYPDGQLRTTIRDYAAFLELFLDPENMLLEDRYRREFLAVQYPDADPRQAVAWHYDEFDSRYVRNIIGYLPAHTGGDPGVITYVVMDPESRSAVILFLNGTRTNFGSIKAIYVDVLEALAREARLGRYSL